MLWVTWRQHRAVLIGVPAVFAAAVAFMLVTGPKVHHDYAILAACHPAASPACVPLSNYFHSTDWHYGNGLRVALLAAPGTLFRRVLPAMAASLGIYVALAAATWFYLRDHYPVSTFWPMQVFEACWLVFLSGLLVAGSVWLVRRHAT